MRSAGRGAQSSVQMDPTEHDQCANREVIYSALSATQAT